jgi:hypothetical protein
MKKCLELNVYLSFTQMTRVAVSNSSCQSTVTEKNKEGTKISWEWLRMFCIGRELGLSRRK